MYLIRYGSGRLIVFISIPDLTKKRMHSTMTTCAIGQKRPDCRLRIRIMRTVTSRWHRLLSRVQKKKCLALKTPKEQNS